MNPKAPKNAPKLFCIASNIYPNRHPIIIILDTHLDTYSGSLE